MAERRQETEGRGNTGRRAAGCRRWKRSAIGSPLGSRPRAWGLACSIAWACLLGRDWGQARKDRPMAQIYLNPLSELRLLFYPRLVVWFSLDDKYTQLFVGVVARRYERGNGLRGLKKTSELACNKKEASGI